MNDDLKTQVAAYRISPEATDLVRNTSILCLVGPTAAGKDSIKHVLLETGKYHHIVSHTTRRPRVNQGVQEQDGLEYHFISTQTAQIMLQNQAFIEAKVYSNNLYGTSVAEIEIAHDEGRIAVTDLEVQGVAEYKAISSSVLAVFILPPNFAIWQERLRKRYGDTFDQADYKLRMQTAAAELQQLSEADYYVAVVNDEWTVAAALINELAHGGALSADQIAHARTVAAELLQEISTYITTL